MTRASPVAALISTLTFIGSLVLYVVKQSFICWLLARRCRALPACTAKLSGFLGEGLVTLAAVGVDLRSATRFGIGYAGDNLGLDGGAGERSGSETASGALSIDGAASADRLKDSVLVVVLIRVSGSTVAGSSVP